ncbi:alpha/beta fold hydrolase [Demequina flava]|uniref:alpha/beta fold hydrolase n=1 Tax=Demequina flava TaxID=1095025 RepID=UPI0007819779|nr:alpha/beta hydrolase [Demequina flava]
MQTMRVDDGRNIGVHGSPAPAGGVTVFWHHGTPGTGAPPPVALPREDWTWAGVDRPGYGGSERLEGRSVADSAADVRAVADHWGLDRFAVVGYSGGGPHALACAGADARVQWAVTVASLAPRDAAELDWFGGMIASGVQALGAAEEGELARRRLDDDLYDPEFTLTDQIALEGELAWLGEASSAAAQDMDGPIDDDLAYVRPWGVDIDAVQCPVIAVHGGADGIAPVWHSRWLIKNLRRGYLVERPDAGHVSALTRLPYALELMAERSAAQA